MVGFRLLPKISVVDDAQLSQLCQSEQAMMDYMDGLLAFQVSSRNNIIFTISF